MDALTYVPSPMALRVIRCLEHVGSEWVGRQAELAAAVGASRRGLQLVLESLARSGRLVIHSARGHWTRIILVARTQAQPLPRITDAPASLAAPRTRSEKKGYDAEASARLAQAREAAARMPRIDDPAVIDAIAIGFTWNGPGPSVVDLWAQYSRSAIVSGMAELRRRRHAEADREGRPILLNPGALLGALREKWAQPVRSSALATAHADALATAHADAPASSHAVALAAPSTARAGASDSSSVRPSSNTTPTRGRTSHGGGGGEVNAGLAAELAAPGGVKDLGVLRYLARQPADLVRAAIDLSKASQRELHTGDWGRFVRRHVDVGNAQAELERRQQAAARGEEARRLAALRRDEAVQARAVELDQARDAQEQERARAAAMSPEDLAAAVDLAARRPGLARSRAARYSREDLAAWREAVLADPVLIAAVFAAIDRRAAV